MYFLALMLFFDSKAGMPTRSDSAGTDWRPPGCHFIKAIKKNKNKVIN